MSDRTYADVVRELQDLDDDLAREAADWIVKLHFAAHEIGEGWLRRVQERSEN